jgi:hypothetical protein
MIARIELDANPTGLNFREREEIISGAFEASGSWLEIDIIISLHCDIFPTEVDALARVKSDDRLW